MKLKSTIPVDHLTKFSRQDCERDNKMRAEMGMFWTPCLELYISLFFLSLPLHP